MLLSGVVTGQHNIPDSSVDAVHKAPRNYPAGKDGHVLTVEFTVMGFRAWTQTADLSSRAGLAKQIERRTSFHEFFNRSPKMNSNVSLIKGVVCGIHSND